MITPSTIYWIGQCDFLRDACTDLIFLGAIFGGISVTLTLFAFHDYEVPRKGAWCGAVISTFLILLLVIGFVGKLFIPSSKTAAAMYVIPAIANNEKIQDAGDRLYTLAVEWMEELRPKSEGKKDSDKDNNQ